LEIAAIMLGLLMIKPSHTPSDTDADLRPSPSRAYAHGWAGALALALMMTGCTTYRIASRDGGDASAPDAPAAEGGGSDGGLSNDAGRDADNPGDGAAAEASDGGADRAAIPDAAPDGAVDAPADIAGDSRADASSDADAPPDLSNIAAPRLIAPLSTATVTSRRPLLHWLLAPGTDGAHVQICHDRACTNPVIAFDAPGTSGAPTVDLPTGVVFWRVSGRSGAMTGTPSTPTWQFNVGARSALVNTSWGTTLDVNGDGYADVLVGGSTISRAYLYMGGPLGLSSSQQPIVLVGPDGGFFANTLADAGDVNGDGYADIIIGAFNYLNGTGRAYLYLGGTSGISPTQQPIVLLGPDGVGAFFGSSVGAAGDVNGDGYADVIVGASSAGGGPPLATGRAHLYLGGPSGPSSVNSIDLNAPDGQGSFFGSVASAGDVNGDGYADVIVGAAGALNSTGRAYLYLGSAFGVSTNQLPLTLTGPDVGGTFGVAVAGAGDVNGDGYADVVIRSGIGRLYMYLGGALGISAAQQPISLPASNSVASAGDVNGDGYSDVVSGALVYQGSGSGPSSSQSVTLTNPDGLAETAAGAGDVNGDGYADVIIGNSDYMDCLGRVYLYLGGASGFSPTQLPIILTSPDLHGAFGISVASIERPPPPTAPALGSSLAGT
jgi:hypothetical protein